jgi:hypothetical protein
MESTERNFIEFHAYYTQQQYFNPPALQIPSLTGLMYD